MKLDFYYIKIYSLLFFFLTPILLYGEDQSLQSKKKKKKKKNLWYYYIYNIYLYRLNIIFNYLMYIITK